MQKQGVTNVAAYANLADQPARAVPKKAQTKQARGSKSRKARGQVTDRAAEAVVARAGGVCEMCGRAPEYGTFRDRLEIAHLINRSQGGRGDQPWLLAHLCGPAVNSGTCHWLIDDRRKSHRDWVNDKIAELKARYNPADWPA